MESLKHVYPVPCTTRFRNCCTLDELSVFDHKLIPGSELQEVKYMCTNMYTDDK